MNWNIVSWPKNSASFSILGCTIKIIISYCYYHNLVWSPIKHAVATCIRYKEGASRKSDPQNQSYLITNRPIEFIDRLIILKIWWVWMFKHLMQIKKKDDRCSFIKMKFIVSLMWKWMAANFNQIKIFLNAINCIMQSFVWINIPNCLFWVDFFVYCALCS